MFLIAAKLKSCRYTQAKEYSSSTTSNYKKSHISGRYFPSYLHNAKSMVRTYKSNWLSSEKKWSSHSNRKSFRKLSKTE